MTKRTSPAGIAAFLRNSPFRRVVAGVLGGGLACILGGEVAASGGGAAGRGAMASPPVERAATQPDDRTGPRATLDRFDSLLTDGSPAALTAARALTAGPARRLFPLLAETQRALAAALDTARSRDTVLAEARARGKNGEWAALKVRADLVFRKPFLGMTEMTAEQVIHLHRHDASSSGARGVWRVVEFEEPADAAAPPVARTDSGPAGEDAEDDNAAAGTDNAGDAGVARVLPLSARAPARSDHARVTRLRLRVAARDGSAPRELEVRRAVLRDSLPTGRAAHRPDSLGLYLASTRELDLTDKMLRTRAAALAQGSRSDVETARRVWTYVKDSFDYKLGATLFATSREALRTMKGDCSEAAVLTAALLRAAGVPSRVVLGYASLGQGVWIGHAWAEAWLGGSEPGAGTGGGWIGLDAALREFPTGPHRVALVALSGRESGGDMKTAATNLMLSTLNNLDIEILGAWAGNEEIPLVAHPEAAAEARRFWEQIMDGMAR